MVRGTGVAPDELTIMAHRWYWNSSPGFSDPCFQAANDDLEKLNEYPSRCRRNNGVESGASDKLQGSGNESDENETAGMASEYVYQLRVRNTGEKVITSIVWEYIFAEPRTGKELARHTFFNQTKLTPGQVKTLEAASIKPPSRVVTAEMLAQNNTGGYSERVTIKRVTYADGSIWQVQ
jgi:hypothetical protein